MALTLSAVLPSNSPISGSMWTAAGATDATAAAAQNVYCGFTPSRIEVMNITDQITDVFVTGMTSDKSRHTLANGTVTDAVANGFVLLTGTEVVPASTLVAQGTNGVGGAGFKIGTGPLVASKSYVISAWR